MSQPIPLEETIESQENNHAETQLIQPPQPPQQQSYRLHSINAAVVIRQIPSQGLSFQLWPAAATLVALLDRRPTPLFLSGHRRILELGSGTGLVGISAAALLGASVTVTDAHVLPNLRFNVEANAGILELHGGAVDVAALPWGDSEHMEGIINGSRDHQYDVIMGSDVVYHDHLYEPLLQTLRFLISRREKGQVVFVMAHLKRWKESTFFKKAKKFLDVEVVHTDSPSSGCRVGVTVYRFVRKGGEEN